MKLRRTTPRRTTPRRTTPRRTSRARRLKRTRSRAARRLRGGSRHRRDNGYSYKTIAALGTAGVAGALALRALTKKQKEPTPPLKLETETQKKLREIKSRITTQFTLRDVTQIPVLNTALTDVYCIVACNDEEEREQTRLQYYIDLIITLQLSPVPSFMHLKDDDLKKQTQFVKSATSWDDFYSRIQLAQDDLRRVNSNNTRNVILNTVDAISNAMVRQDELEHVEENVGDVLVDTELDAIITKYTVFNQSWMSEYVIIERDPYHLSLNDKMVIDRIGTLLKNGTPTLELVQKYHKAKELVRVYRLFFKWAVQNNDTRDETEYGQLRETFKTLKNSGEDAYKQRRELLKHLLGAKSKDFGHYYAMRDTEPDILQVCDALKKVSELSTQIRTETCPRAAE